MISKNTITVAKLRKILVRSPFCGLKGFCNFSLAAVLLFNYRASIYMHEKFYKKPINDLSEGKEVAMLHLRDSIIPFLEVVTMVSLMLFLPQNLYFISFLKSPFGCILLMSAICCFLRIFGLRDCCVDTVVDQNRPYIDGYFLLLSSLKEKRRIVIPSSGKDCVNEVRSCCEKKTPMEEKSTVKIMSPCEDSERNNKKFKEDAEKKKKTSNRDFHYNIVCGISSPFALFPMIFFFSSLQLSASLALCSINILELPLILLHDLTFDRKEMSLLKTSKADIADLSKDCAKSFVSVISLGILSLRIPPSSELNHSNKFHTNIQTSCTKKRGPQ